MTTPDPTSTPPPDPSVTLVESENISIRTLTQEQVDAIVEKHQEWIRDCYEEYVASIETVEDTYLFDSQRAHANDPRRANFSGCHFTTPPDLREKDLRGANLENAYLENANMREANLENANMEDVYLENADMIGAHLENAYLRGAHCEEVDFSGATLTDVEASQANFAGAKFYVTTIRSCDFSFCEFRDWHKKTKLEDGSEKVEIIETEGLFDSQFADCDLTGARLPEGIAKFEFLYTINESTKANQRLVWHLLLAGVAIPLALLSGNDLNVQAIGLAIPHNWLAITGFLFLGYWYLHTQLNLQRHWELLDRLPSKFPDGLSCDKRIQPWFVNGFILIHRTYLRKTLNETHPWYHWQYGLITCTVWFVTPIALAFINGVLYANSHLVIAIPASILTLACAGFALAFRKQAIATLNGEKFSWKDLLTIFKRKPVTDK